MLLNNTEVPKYTIIFFINKKKTFKITHHITNKMKKITQ